MGLGENRPPHEGQFESMCIRNQASKSCVEKLRHNGFMKHLLFPLLAALSLQGGAFAETYYRWSEDPMTDERSLHRT